jgi:predicted DNA-binding protein (UPF0251 family)
LNKTTKNGKNLENYISQVEAARIRGVSPQAIANLVRRGRLTTVNVVGRILVLRSEVESFAQRPQGRPTKETQARARSLKKPSDVTDRKTLEEYISQAEAARIRGISQEAIADLIRRGRLAAVSVAGRTLILRAEVEAFVPQPIGRPPQKKTVTRAPKPKKAK